MNPSADAPSVNDAAGNETGKPLGDLLADQVELLRRLTSLGEAQRGHIESGDVDALLEVLKQRTDWYKVRAGNGVEGWASVDSMSRTMQPDGRPAKIENPDRDDFSERRREVGVLLGDFDGANAVSAYVSWLFTPNLSAEISGTHLTGRFSNGWMANVNIVHQPFPEWRISPFFTLGTGVLQINPKATLVAAEDRTDQTAHAGLGLRAYVSKRLLLRAEYKSYVVFTSRDDNEEVSEWKAGISFFF